ncbi:MAG: hypothetical protein AAGJ90_19750 [Pseudomonadota bacterium]
MNLTVLNNEKKLSSIDFLNEIINPARESHGENPVSNRDFIDRVCDELDLKKENFLLLDTGTRGRKPLYTMLDMEQMTLVGMRESKSVRRNILDTLKKMREPEWMRNISPEALILIEDLNKKAEHLQLETQRLNRVCNDMASHFTVGMTVVEFCRQLNGVNLNQVQNELIKMKVLQRSFGVVRPAPRVRDDYFREVATQYEAGEKTKNGVRIEVLERGAKWIYSKYLKGQLPMKKTWNKEFTHKVF